ncbi:MAG: hypothetical protein QW046_04315 [Candidatus Micrarchaeaceae archaeon]
MVVQNYITKINDATISVRVDDNNVITHIAIRQGARVLLYMKEPPLSNIQEGINFIKSISNLDNIDDIYRAIVSFMDEQFKPQQTEPATFHTEIYSDPDYIDILKEKDEEEKRKNKQQKK